MLYANTTPEYLGHQVMMHGRHASVTRFEAHQEEGSSCWPRKTSVVEALCWS